MSDTNQEWTRREMFRLVVVTLTGILVYRRLGDVADWLVFETLRMERGEEVTRALWLIARDAPRVLIAVTGVVFVTGVARSFMSGARVRGLLAGRGDVSGSLMGTGLGAISPYSPGDATPILGGFLRDGISWGATFAFLAASSMVNEVAFAIMAVLFGVGVAVLYVMAALGISAGIGLLMARVRPERFLRETVAERAIASEIDDGGDDRSGWSDRLESGLDAVRAILGGVWGWAVLGVVMGAVVCAWLPDDTLRVLLGPGAWWMVALAALAAMPMYANAAGIFPLVYALHVKGAALGTVMTFMMSVVGLSFAELISLRQVFRSRLVWMMMGCLAGGMMTIGWLLN